MHLHCDGHTLALLPKTPNGRLYSMEWNGHRRVQVHLIASRSLHVCQHSCFPCAPKQAAIMANIGEWTAANSILLEGTPPSPVKNTEPAETDIGKGITINGGNSCFHLWQGSSWIDWGELLRWWWQYFVLFVPTIFVSLLFEVQARWQ